MISFGIFMSVQYTADIDVHYPKSSEQVLPFLHRSITENIICVLKRRYIAFYVFVSIALLFPTSQSFSHPAPSKHVPRAGSSLKNRTIMFRCSTNTLGENFFFFFFFKVFGGHMSFFWGHWYPCFGFLVTSPLGFKARVGSALFAIFCGGECNVHSPRFTSSATLADLLAAGAQPVTSPHACAEVALGSDSNRQSSRQKTNALPLCQRPGLTWGENLTYHLLSIFTTRFSLKS